MKQKEKWLKPVERSLNTLTCIDVYSIISRRKEKIEEILLMKNSKTYQIRLHDITKCYIVQTYFRYILS